MSVTIAATTEVPNVTGYSKWQLDETGEEVDMITAGPATKWYKSLLAYSTLTVDLLMMLPAR